MIMRIIVSLVDLLNNLKRGKKTSLLDCSIWEVIVCWHLTYAYHNI